MDINRIDVNFESKDSIKNGLEELTLYMKKIFKLSKNEPYGLTEIPLPEILKNGKELTKEEMFDTQTLDSVIMLSCDLSKDILFRDNNFEFDNSFSVFSQCYLVQKALENNLDEEVLTLAQEIVTYSVSENDSDSLWYDDCNVYGIDILAVLAINRQEYIYMISEYIIPYWDDEHAPYIFEYLPYFKSEFGFSKGVLKAFAYCHTNYNLFIVFKELNEDYEEISSGELYKHFRENLEDYNYFKKEYFEYLKKYPRSNEDENYVHISTRLFDVIIGEGYDKSLKDDFHGKTLEEEIEDFADEVDEILEKFDRKDYPFVRSEDGDYEELEDYEEDIEDMIRINEEFFIKGFENGNKLYDYVLFGKNEELLEKLPVIKDLKKFARQKELEIIKRFEYEGCDSLWEIIAPFITQQLDCNVRQSFIGKFLNKNRDISPKERALRALDVLVRIKGETLEDFVINNVTKDFELCTLDEFFKRYSLFKNEEDLIKEIQSIMNNFYRDTISKEDLEQLNMLFLKDKNLWDEILDSVMHNKAVGVDEDIVAVLPALSKPNINGSYLATVAYVIYKNYKANDKDIEKLIKFYEKNILVVFASILYQNGKTRYYVENDEVDQSHLVSEVVDYAKGSFPPPPPKEIMQKLMKDGVDSLNKEELQIFEEAKQKAKEFKVRPYSEIEEILRELAYLNEDESKSKHLGKELGIDMISFFSSDDIQALLASIIYVYKYLPISLQEQAKRIYTMFLDIAPVKTINMTSKSFFSFYDLKNIDEDPKIYYDFIDFLEDFRIKPEYIIAWEINRAVRHGYYYDNDNFFDKKLEVLVDEYADLYEDIDSTLMLASFERAKKDALKKSIKHLDFETRREFLKFVNQKTPVDEYFECCKVQFDMMVVDFAKRLTPWENPEWNMKEDEKIAYRKEINKRADMVESYIFGKSSFDDIENTIIKENHDYAPEDLSEIIHFFDEEIQKRYLYLLGRLAYINRIYDYFREAFPEEFETYGLTHKLFYLLKEVGISDKISLLFIVTQAMRDEQYGEDEEDKNFVRAFLDVYTKIDLLEACKDYKENRLIFIIRMIAEDDDKQNLEKKKEYLEEFNKHSKLKVQKAAKKFLDEL